MTLKKRTKIVLLVLVLLLGIYLRFAHIDLTRFEHEMVRDLEISKQIVEGELLAHGVLPAVDSTEQNTLGPLAYYLMALGFLLPLSTYYLPLAPIFIIALLDLLAAFLAYRIGKEFFSETVGLLTLAFYLLSPWQIVHIATVLSPTSFLPFFVVLFFYSLFKLVIQKKTVWLVPAILALAAQLHFHLTPLILGFSFLVILLLFRKTVQLKYFILGCLLALLLFVPYLVYNYQLGDLLTPYNLVTQRAESTYLQTTLESFGIPLLYMVPYLAPYTLGKVTLFSSLTENYFLTITVIILFLFAASLLYVLCRMKKSLHKKLEKDKTFRTYTLLLLLYFIPLILFSIKGSNVAPHYFVIVFPLQLLILSIFIDYLLKRWKKITLVLITLLLASNAIYISSYYTFVDANGGTKGLSGIPYNNKVEVVEYILADAEGKPKLVYYAGQTPLVDSMHHLFSLREPVEVTFIETVDEYEEGYLIIDRYSFYKDFTNAVFPKEDHKKLDEMKPMKFKQLELIKKP